MIEIIKAGTKNQIKCGYCGAVLAYQTSDVKNREEYINQRDTHTVHYIICHQCKSEVIK